MKRVGFLRRQRREDTQTTYTPRPRAVAVARTDVDARMVVPIPKENVKRDEAYLRLVATLPCAWCGFRGASQAAHANQGKGMGMKAGDETAMPLCADRPGVRGCHTLLDQSGVMTKEQRRYVEELWGNRTRTTLRRLAEFDPEVRRIVERTLGL